MRQQLQQRAEQDSSGAGQNPPNKSGVLLLGGWWWSPSTPEAYYEMLPLSKQRQAAPLQSHLSIQWSRVQKPQQQLSNFGCFFCSAPTLFLSVFVSSAARGRGGRHMTDSLYVSNSCYFVNLVPVAFTYIWFRSLFGDIARPTLAMGQYVLCPTPSLPCH